MNRKKYQLEESIRNGEYGASTQFFYSAEKEFRLVSDFSAYDIITQKFEALKQELKSMMERKRSSTSDVQPETKLNMLTEKFKTPFDKRTYSAITKPTEESSSESNRSRKRTADQVEQPEEKQTKSKKNKKTTKKKKKVKTKQKEETKETDKADQDEDNPSKKAKLDKKSKIESPSLVHLNKLVPKTPMTNRLSNRIQSTIKKTIKSKPLTRRAAAAMAAAKSTNQDGHVKKMVNKIEQKIVPTPQTQRKLMPQSSIQKTITKLKAIRSSIDKRKSALSISKLAVKRKSEKLVKAFVKDLKETKIVLTDDGNNRISINAKTVQEKNLLDDMMAKSPKLVLSKIPTSLTRQSQSVSANIAGKVMENNEKRLSKELMLNSSVLSQYRPVNLKTAVSASTIKATPSKPIFGSVGNLTNQHLYSKFTPSKLTRTEIDEKKKADLLAKEQKEKERLAELERQKQEKLNEAKRKRDEKLKKVNEAKQKQKEDAEQKAKEMELKEKQRLENEKLKKMNPNNSSVLVKQSVMSSAQKKNILNPVNLNANKSTVVINKDNCSEFVNSFKKSLLLSQQFQTAQKLQKQKTVTLLKSEDKNNLEQTYVLNSPNKKAINQSSYECTPLQPPRLKDEDNYDVSDIRSDDDTDDEDEPSKPIPMWAKEPHLSQKAQDQCMKAINFTRLFRSACQAEINLEQIFKTKRRKFVERSSSANWNTPPIWSTNGISGEESFMQLRKNL